MDHNGTASIELSHESSAPISNKTYKNEKNLTRDLFFCCADWEHAAKVRD